VTTRTTTPHRSLVVHARYGLMNLLMLGNLAGMSAGGAWTWAGFFAAVVLATLGDEAAGDDRAPIEGASARWFDAQLFLTLPLLAANLVVLALLWSDGPAFGLVTALHSAGIDIAAARAATGGWSLLGATLAAGLFTGAAGTNVAHELIHRTDDRLAYGVGRVLLSFSFDTGFAIEHVHGHHRTVGTEADPATARRGESVYAFVLRSTIEGTRSAAAIERARLGRRGSREASFHNRFLRGQVISIAYLLGMCAVAGWAGVVVAVLVAAQAKLYLELVNYVEHYGLVRVPGERIEARHSWNCDRLLSAALLYNLPRHSHHHLFASKPYWTLEAERDAPVTPFGYKVMILIALVPPIWRRLMHPRLADWDERLASEAERRWLRARGLLLARRAA